jgi:hypothetical protein
MRLSLLRQCYRLGPGSCEQGCILVGARRICGFNVSMFFAGRRRWSKDVVRWELMARHRHHLELSWKRVPGNLRAAAATYFGSYRRAIEAIGLDYESIQRRRPSWSRRAIISELRKLHEKGVLETMRDFSAGAPALYSALRSHFGGLAAAMKAAGIPMREQRWSKEKVIEELRRRMENDEEIASGAVDAGLKSTAQRYFGGYREALEAAGLDYTKIRKTEKWDRQRILETLRELGAAKQKLKAARIKARSHGLYEAMIREFGTIGDAAKAAGVRYEQPRHWGPLEIFDELRERLRSRKSIAVTEMKERTPALVTAATRVFGSYAQAVATLGLTYEQVRKTHEWSEERILSELRKLVESGVKPNATDLGRACPQLVAASYKYFGGPREALKAAGIEYQRRRPWSGARVAEKLRELASAGEDLSPLALRKKYGTLSNRAWRLCGSYRKAIEMAGLDYLEVTKHATWDRRSVLRKLRELATSGADVGYRAMHTSHPRLLDAAKRAFGSYPNARKAAGVGPEPLTQWTNQKIVRELRKLQRAGESLAASRIHTAHPALYDAAKQHFGGYGKALEAIGLKYEQVRLTRAWTNDSIIAELKALDEKDVDMRSLPLRKVDHGLHMAAYKHFGSYQNALEAAGIEYPPKKPLAGWKRSQVLARLRELHEEGEDLRYAAMKEKHSPLFFAARYYFDAYITAVKRARLDYDRIVREQLHGKKKWRRVVSVEVSPAVVAAEKLANAGGASGTAGATGQAV